MTIHSLHSFFGSYPSSTAASPHPSYYKTLKAEAASGCRKRLRKCGEKI